jgi:hypothetical protein
VTAQWQKRKASDLALREIGAVLHTKALLRLKPRLQAEATEAGI